MRAIPTLLSVLLPDTCPACDGPGGVGASRLCGACEALIPRLPRAIEAPPPLAGAFALGAYAGPLGALVRRGKYRPDAGAMIELGRRLGEAARGRMPGLDAVVHVPVPAGRRLRRGFDQGELLARAVARALELPALSPLLRVRGAEQAGRTHRERRAGPRGAFLTHATALPSRILLVDDVCTTGGTAAACATELLGAGARSVLLLVAAAGHV